MKSKIETKDVLYITGAVLVSLGLGIVRPPYGLISAGIFLLLVPLLELVSGFLRGLRG
jgi:hypothetical protein